MKYDYMVQFANLANEESEKGKIRLNIIASFLKNLPIKQGTMKSIEPATSVGYKFEARSQQLDRIELEKKGEKLKIDIQSDNKALTSNVDCEKETINTTGFIKDETGLYLYDGRTIGEENEKRAKFTVAFYDMEAINYINSIYHESFSHDLNYVMRYAGQGYVNPELVDIKIIQDMLAGRIPMDNDRLKVSFLKQGIQPDDEIEREIEIPEIIEMSTTIYRIEPHIFMEDNKAEMTM